jgi:hypothetical protein
MQAVVTVVSVLVQLSVILAFRYLQITWLILSGIGGISRAGWLRELWISSVRKIGLVIIAFLIISILWSSTFFATPFPMQIFGLFSSIDVKTGDTTVGEILASSIFSDFTWLLVALAVAQGLAVQKHVSEFNWFTWMLSSIFGAILGSVFAMGLQSNASQTWGFLTLILSSLCTAIGQLFTLGYLSSERRAMLIPVWLTGWINVAVFIYLCDFLVFKFSQDYYAFRNFLLEMNPQIQYIVTLIAPTLLVTGWLGLMSNMFILSNVLPDEAFEPDEDSKPTAGELFAFGLANVSGQIAGNMTREVGKVVGDEFKRSTRR